MGGRSALEGRLEVELGRRWGIAQTGYITSRTPGIAQVVCRSLGLRGGALRYGDFWGRGTLPPLIYGLGCLGTEASLSGCAYAVPGEFIQGATTDTSMGVACGGQCGWVG